MSFQISVHLSHSHDARYNSFGIWNDKFHAVKLCDLWGLCWHAHVVDISKVEPIQVQTGTIDNEGGKRNGCWRWELVDSWTEIWERPHKEGTTFITSTVFEFSMTLLSFLALLLISWLVWNSRCDSSRLGWIIAEKNWNYIAGWHGKKWGSKPVRGAWSPFGEREGKIQQRAGQIQETKSWMGWKVLNLRYSWGTFCNYTLGFFCTFQNRKDVYLWINHVSEVCIGIVVSHSDLIKLGFQDFS